LSSRFIEGNEDRMCDFVTQVASAVHCIFHWIRNSSSHVAEFGIERRPMTACGSSAEMLVESEEGSRQIWMSGSPAQGFKRETWNTGWMQAVSGNLSSYATVPMWRRIRKGP
jgi:hypothetical protein